MLRKKLAAHRRWIGDNHRRMTSGRKRPKSVVAMTRFYRGIRVEECEVVHNFKKISRSQGSAVRDRTAAPGSSAGGTIMNDGVGAALAGLAMKD
jgi:hypothetical protein